METSDQLVDTREIGKRLTALGQAKHHLLRNLRTAGYVLHKVRRSNGHSGYAVTKEDAERYLLSFEQNIPESYTPEKISGAYEEQIRKQREGEGWISYRLASAGMPDLLNIKSHGDGFFEILFEEVKGLNDHLRKDQHLVLEEMKKKGIPATITWF
jgi:hypothetical protein